MPPATLPTWVTDTGQVIVVIAAATAAITAIGTWIKRSIGKMIDDKIDPIYDRLDAHMTEEDKSLQLIAQALKVLSDHLNPPQ